MSFRLARVRSPEWALGVVSVALLVVLFGLRWYGYRDDVAPGLRGLDDQVGANGWESLTVLGPLTAVVAVLGLAIWVAQATRGAPALPVALVVVELALALILVVGLIVRVLIDPPSVTLPGSGAGNAIEPELGAYLGLALAILAALAAYASLRLDGVAEADGPQWIETLPLEG
jgi:hypothetical protein